MAKKFWRLGCHAGCGKADQCHVLSRKRFRRALDCGQIDAGPRLVFVVAGHGRLGEEARMALFPKAGFRVLLLATLTLSSGGAFAAEESSPPVQAIVSGEVRSGSTEVRGHGAITLAQAIDTAGGFSEWAFSIVIRPPSASAQGDAPINSQRITIHDYNKNAWIRKMQLEPGTRVVVLKLGCRLF